MGIGRPPLSVGTMGKIRLYKVSTGYRARALFRDFDGRTRELERTASGKGAATRALKEAVRDRVHLDGNAEITPDTRVKDLAQAWVTSLDAQSPTTIASYRNRVLAQIIPGLGHRRVRELSIGAVDRFLQDVASENGAAVAKMTRSVLSGMCGLAARHDALPRNPVKDARSITQPRRAAPKSLTLAQVRQLRAMITYDNTAVARDLPDFVAFMLASGLRIGEASAITWDVVDLDAGTVEVRGTVIRLKGHGLLLTSTTKSTAGMRTLALPTWCVEVLRHRAQRLHASGVTHGADPVFPAPKGGLRDPSNTQGDLRETLVWCGLPGITSHIFRKTTATLLDNAGLSARTIADQLGHAQPSVTQNVYMGRKIASTQAATVLQQLA